VVDFADAFQAAFSSETMPHEAAVRVDSVRELQTETLRVTAFLAPSTQVSEPAWWADLVGTQPETRNSRPGRGEFQDAGPLGDGTLVLSVQPGRVDWLLTPRQEAGAPSEIKWTGRFPDALEVFDPLIRRWLANCPPLIRLAFGAVVFEQVSDIVAGYRRLAEYLPGIQIDPEGSSDFFYQINRPRNSTLVDTLRINRLSKWSVTQFLPFRLMVAPHLIQSLPIGSGELACRIELDISTTAEFVGELPRAKLPQLFEELKNLATEVATRGDIP